MNIAEVKWNYFSVQIIKKLTSYCTLIQRNGDEDIRNKTHLKVN